LLSNNSKVPLARSEDLLVERVSDELVIYDLENKEAHCLKPLASSVFSHSDGESSVAQIMETVEADLGHSVTEAEILDAVAQLEQIRLLITPSLLVVDGNGGISRREMMRRVGYAGAAATVGTALVTSIAAPSALAACSGQPAGCNCTKNNPDCASNHCCSGNGNDKCNVGCCSSTNNGQDCQCQANGTCGSIPQPGNCCAGTCTPTTGNPCTAAGAVQGAKSGGLSLSGGGGTSSFAPTTSKHHRRHK
jgi:hypothetical protein